MQYVELNFVCIYNEDVSEIHKHLSFRQYASIMEDIMIYSAELVFFQPILYEDATSCALILQNELTPWKRAGITDFNICHVFDFDITTSCPKYAELVNYDQEYFAIGSFEIAALQQMDEYKDKIIQIFTSTEFINIFTQQMNIILSNYTTYNSFVGIEFMIMDEFNTTTRSPTSTRYNNIPSTTLSADSKENNNDSSNQSLSPFTELVIVNLVLMICIIVINVGFCTYYYRKNLNMSKDVKMDIVRPESIDMDKNRVKLEEAVGNIYKKDIGLEDAIDPLTKNEYKEDEDEEDNLLNETNPFVDAFGDDIVKNEVVGNHQKVRNNINKY